MAERCRVRSRIRGGGIRSRRRPALAPRSRRRAHLHRRRLVRLASAPGHRRAPRRHRVHVVSRQPRAVVALSPSRAARACAHHLPGLEATLTRRAGGGRRRVQRRAPRTDLAERQSRHRARRGSRGVHLVATGQRHWTGAARSPHCAPGGGGLGDSRRRRCHRANRGAFRRRNRADAPRVSGRALRGGRHARRPCTPAGHGRGCRPRRRARRNPIGHASGRAGRDPGRPHAGDWLLGRARLLRRRRRDHDRRAATRRPTCRDIRRAGLAPVRGAHPRRIGARRAGVGRSRRHGDQAVRRQRRAPG